MEKEKFITAYWAICEIEELFNKADDLFQSIPPEIQQAILDYHAKNGTMQHCIRWGLTAAGEIREDWHTVVSELGVEDDE